MLVLRLMLMVLTIICLMDGHAEVSSSTTGIRNRRESPVVKPNETEVQILDRKKKKKPKKPKKPSKKKKPKPKKPKPAKPVTTTPTMTTSTLKTTTILTTPTVETTATTTDFPTTTATTFKTTSSTATTTEASSSTASTTTATTTMTTTATTSSLITTAATTADSGAEGECKATNGKPCIFPFKDGKEEYNECKNHGGTYFWCATAVYDSGKYKHWSYCPKDGPCPLEGDGEECRAINNKPCVFPFKDGKKEYNECADHGGQYFWCATGTNSAGKYTAWSECPKDGSCPLPQKSTTPGMTSTASTTPLTTGTTVATDQMEEKVLGTLENLVLGESRDDSLQMTHMLNKKLDTIIKDLEGKTSKTELSNFDDIPPESEDKVRDGTQLGEGLMFVLSTVDSMKSVSRMSGDCCLDCTSKHPDTELAEYWETLDICYCYKKFKNPDVEPKTRASNKFTTKACATGSTCKLTRANLDCPTDFPETNGDYMWDITRGKENAKISSKDACESLCLKDIQCHAIIWDSCPTNKNIPMCRRLTSKYKIIANGPFAPAEKYCKRNMVKQFRCYSYNHKTPRTKSQWYHRYMWHQTYRIPLFSVARFDAYTNRNREYFFISDDIEARPYLGCGNPVDKEDPDVNIIPTTDYLVSNNDLVRGHLLGAQFFPKFFPGDIELVTKTSRYMSNIFPSSKDCDNKGLWHTLENDIVKAAEGCIKGDLQSVSSLFSNVKNPSNKDVGIFYLSHGLITEDDTTSANKFGQNKNIQRVQATFTNFCCVKKGSKDILAWNAYLYNNPQDGVDCNPLGQGSTAFAEYEKLLKPKITETNIGSLLWHPFYFANPDIPSDFDKKTCIIGFQEPTLNKIEFPST